MICSKNSKLIACICKEIPGSFVEINTKTRITANICLCECCNTICYGCYEVERVQKLSRDNKENKGGDSK